MGIRKQLTKIKSKIINLLDNKSHVPFRKNSYSQCGEDLIVQHIFRSLEIKSPTYIDIGAHHPYYISNTALFYENGCRGINIEPDPNLFALFPSMRPQDINLNIGISEVPSVQEFFVMSTPTLNTFSKEEVLKYQTETDYKLIQSIMVQTDTVSNIINKYAKGKFPDFISLDAEGVDWLILKSIDFERNSPKVICIETISFSTKGAGEKQYEIISFLESMGYLLYADTNINSIFVKKSWWIR